MIVYIVKITMISQVDYLHFLIMVLFTYLIIET